MKNWIFLLLFLPLFCRADDAKPVDAQLKVISVDAYGIFAVGFLDSVKLDRPIFVACKTDVKVVDGSYFAQPIVLIGRRHYTSASGAELTVAAYKFTGPPQLSDRDSYPASNDDQPVSHLRSIGGG